MKSKRIKRREHECPKCGRKMSKTLNDKCFQCRNCKRIEGLYRKYF